MVKEERINVEVTKKTFEYVIYCIFCVLSFGMLAVMRVVISEGVRQAFKNQR